MRTKILEIIATAIGITSTSFEVTVLEKLYVEINLGTGWVMLGSVDITNTSVMLQIPNIKTDIFFLEIFSSI